MFYADVLNAYLQYCTVERRLAVSTIRAYGPWLRHYARFAESTGHNPLLFTQAMSPILLKRYLYDCSAKKYRPRTIRNTFNALRGLVRFGVEQGYIESDPTKGITMPKKDAAERPIASDADLTKLMQVVEHERDPKRRARERAMLYVLIMTGVRFSELLDIKEGDVDLPRRVLYIRSGKGDKARTLYPPADCINALGEWLVERRKIGAKHDWLWAFSTSRRMGEAGTREMLENLKARADLEHVDAIKPHSLRRAFATRMLRANSDIKSIQAALGHSLAATTFLYLGMHDLPAQAMAVTGGLPAASAFKPTPLPPPVADGRGRKGVPVAPPTAKPSRAETISRMRRRAVGGGRA